MGLYIIIHSSVLQAYVGHEQRGHDVAHNQHVIQVLRGLPVRLHFAGIFLGTDHGFRLTKFPVTYVLHCSWPSLYQKVFSPVLISLTSHSRSFSSRPLSSLYFLLSGLSNVSGIHFPTLRTFCPVHPKRQQKFLCLRIPDCLLISGTYLNSRDYSSSSSSAAAAAAAVIDGFALHPSNKADVFHKMVQRPTYAAIF